MNIEVSIRKGVVLQFCFADRESASRQQLVRVTLSLAKSKPIFAGWKVN